MTYPGNAELSAEAQERVMAAFRQVVSKLQDGQRDQAMIGLEFVLRLDASYAPAINLRDQLAVGAEVDLSQVLAHLQAPTTDEIDLLLVEAVEEYEQRNFLVAKEKVEHVLLELPGHQEARQFLGQVLEALKTENQVAQFLTQAREALEVGNPQEAANFVMMAQALDPRNPAISETLQEVYGSGGAAPQQPQVARPPVREQPLLAVEEPAPVQAPSPGAPTFAAPGPAPSPAVASGAEWEPAGGLQEFAFAAEPPAAGELFSVEPAPEGSSVYADEAPRVDGGEFVWDSASAPVEDIPLAPPPVPAGQGSPQEPAAAAVDQSPGLFTGEDADISDLFQAEVVTEMPAAAPAPTHAAPDGAAARIASLLDQGGQAFDAGDFQEAIDVWSRIILIDPNHAETRKRIEDAKRRKDEQDRRIAQLLHGAEEAARSGDAAKAKELANQILTMQPGHLQAVELKERLTQQAPAPAQRPPGSAIPALPVLDEDLFAEQLSSMDETPSGEKERVPERAVATPAAARTAAPGLLGKLPWPVIAAACGALLVILLGVWFGTQLLSSDEESERAARLNQALDEAEQLYQQGRVAEAVHLLEQYPATGIDNSRIATKLAVYKNALAPPTPTPIPQSRTRAEEMMSAGNWLSAYGEIQRGLTEHPQDQGLLELKEAVLRLEPLIASLHSALQASDYRSAVAIAQDLVSRHESNPEFAAVLKRTLFNAAVIELRAVNLPAAEGHLVRLQKLDPQDEEATRVLRFVEMYKTRSADMQLRVFIGSLTLR